MESEELEQRIAVIEQAVRDNEIRALEESSDDDGGSGSTITPRTDAQIRTVVSDFLRAGTDIKLSLDTSTNSLQIAALPRRTDEEITALFRNEGLGHVVKIGEGNFPWTIFNFQTGDAPIALPDPTTDELWAMILKRNTNSYSFIFKANDVPVVNADNDGSWPTPSNQNSLRLYTSIFNLHVGKTSADPPIFLFGAETRFDPNFLTLYKLPA